jgi:hypothetical protein
MVGWWRRGGGGALVLVAVIIVGCFGDGPNPAVDIRALQHTELILDGEIPAGAATVDRYWVYGAETDFDELRRDAANQLMQDGWRVNVVPGDDPVDAGALYLRSQQDDECYVFFDALSQEGASARSFRFDIPEDDWEAIQSAGHRSLAVLVRISCG